MRHLAWLSLALIAAPLLGAEVYRSVDANGAVVYSDRPSPGAERVYIETGSASLAAGAVAPPAPAGRTEPAAPAEELGGEVRAELPPDELAAQRAANCEVARERLERYTVSQRLFRTLPNGEREYLSDAELDAARAKASADVVSWCD